MGQNTAKLGETKASDGLRSIFVTSSWPMGSASGANNTIPYSSLPNKWPFVINHCTGLRSLKCPLNFSDAVNMKLHTAKMYVDHSASEVKRKQIQHILLSCNALRIDADMD